MSLLRDQRGMTLAELAISLFILGLLILALGMVTVTVIKLTTRNRNHLIALREVQAVGQWITRDGQQSQPSFLGTTDDPGTADLEILQLGWDYTDTPYSLDKYEISYAIQPDHQLRRDVVVNDATASSQIIASHIQSIVVSRGTYVVVVVTAQTGGFESVPRSREYRFMCRSISIS